MKIINKEMEIVSHYIENTIYECSKDALVLKSTNIEELINEDLTLITPYSVNVLNNDSDHFRDFLEEGRICKIRIVVSLKSPATLPEITKELTFRVKIISDNLDYIKESLNYEIYGAPLDSNIFNKDISTQQELILKKINNSISHLIETDSDFREALDQLIVSNSAFYLFHYEQINDNHKQTIKVNLANDTSKREKFRISLYLNIR